jgi:hypothetical protein
VTSQVALRLGAAYGTADSAISAATATAMTVGRRIDRAPIGAGARAGTGIGRDDMRPSVLLTQIRKTAEWAVFATIRLLFGSSSSIFT